jgi:AmmeMemoRadiSam system protein B
MKHVRPAAVAGTFYPGDPAVLKRDVDALLANVQPHHTELAPKAIIVPHAGYIYSGSVAASVYACLTPFREQYRRVVLLGPVHRVSVRGLALPGDFDSFATPLGIVLLDLQGMLRVAALPQVCHNAPAHAWEHSLEVQLPFLQESLNDFTLIPLAVGDATPGEVAGVLEALWGGLETLIVISSDLSHYLPYEAATKIDRATANMILALNPPLSHEQACGGTPVNGLLTVAKAHRLKPECLDLRNSGDTAGDKNRVVGYGAFAFYEGGEYVN